MWLIPSFYGDLRLEAVSGKETKLHAYELTPAEVKAMSALRERATSAGLFKRGWCSEADFAALTSPAYRTREGVTIALRASLADVEEVLSRALRPERQLVKVLRLSDGTNAEIDTYRTLASSQPKELPPKAEEKVHPAEIVPDKAVTVARPVNGCPMPDFAEADVRASRVLEAFLSPAQVRDYRSQGAFLTRGADTGRRYLVGHRERPTLLRANLGGRQLYDLDRQVAICVHDWAVPPPEEMLALHLCLSLPGRESELLSLPEIDPRLAHLDTDPHRITNAEGRRL